VIVSKIGAEDMASRIAIVAFAIGQAGLLPAYGQDSVQKFALESIEQLSPVGVVGEASEFAGAKAVKLTIDPTVSPGTATVDTVTLALIKGTDDFRNGTIEVTLESDVAPHAPPGARGFVGLAFRVAPGRDRFEAFYLRPLNGRADDQVRRNHSTQYMSFPKYDFAPLRAAEPEKYESYVDIGPREWIRVRIDVDGARARLFVNGAAQPTLIVNDLKMGADATGPVGLWIYNGSVAHFRDLRIVRR